MVKKVIKAILTGLAVANDVNSNTASKIECVTIHDPTNPTIVDTYQNGDILDIDGVNIALPTRLNIYSSSNKEILDTLLTVPGKSTEAVVHVQTTLHCSAYKALEILKQVELL